VPTVLADFISAKFGCGPNSQPGGPLGAIYTLYGNAADLNSAFDRQVHSYVSVPCPGTTDPGPIAWQGGMVLCTTSRGHEEGEPRVASRCHGWGCSESVDG
jgi:hypothetical protein